jgi:hypothetical protein
LSCDRDPEELLVGLSFSACLDAPGSFLPGVFFPFFFPETVTTFQISAVGTLRLANPLYSKKSLRIPVTFLKKAD